MSQLKKWLSVTQENSFIQIKMKLTDNQINIKKFK